jgi:nucleotide-binding universal stress UspA family protein
MESIVVATDFSACSRTAVQLAAALARRRQLPLVLVHAVQSPPLDLPAVPIGATAWEMELLASAELELARLAGELREEGISVETRAHVGAPAELILEVAGKVGAEVIVVGTHGRKGAAHLFIGSVAEQVVRRSTVPVLVTREGTPAIPRWRRRSPLRLTIGMDGSAASEAALAWVGRFAKLHPCELLLARLYSPREEAMRYGLDEPWGEHPREVDLLPLLERDLRRDARALIGDAPSRLQFWAAENGASDVLARDAFVQGTDALVVGVPRHRSGAALSAGAVLRRSSLPVLCVPELGAPARRELPQLRSILIATDLSDASTAVVPDAYGLLRSGGGRVELCTVHELGPVDAIAEIPIEAPLRDEQRATVEARLRALIPAEAAAFGITTHVSVIDARSAADAIVAAAERLDVDLVALGSHGRSSIGRVLLGSVAEEVARRSPRPVLIVRARPRGAHR